MGYVARRGSGRRTVDNCGTVEEFLYYNTTD